MKPRNELEDEYRKLAKRADARLRQIEASSRKPEFRAIKKYAYNSALEDIRRHYGGGKRFGTGKSAMPKTDRKLQAKINAIKKFLESPSSTERGVRNIYKARAEFFNEEYGTKFTWKSMANLFENDRFGKLQEIIQGSDEVLNIVGVIQRNKKAIKKALKDSDSRSLDLLDEQGNPVDELTLNDVQSVLNSTDGKDIIEALLK